MKNVGLIVFFVLFIFEGCAKKPLLDETFYNNKISSEIKLSDFLGTHKIILLENSDSCLLNTSARIFKRENIFYATDGTFCYIFNERGQFIHRMNYSSIIDGDNTSIDGVDVYLIDGQPQLWVGYKRKIHRFIINSGVEIDYIPVELPFDNFKRISNETILLSTPMENNILSVADIKGRIETFGLTRKSKEYPNGINLFFKYDGTYLFPYSITTSMAYYDTTIQKIKSIELVFDDGQVNTWKKQAKEIDKYGIIQGYNRASSMYITFLHMQKISDLRVLIYCQSGNFYLNIKREGTKSSTINILPSNRYLHNDIIAVSSWNYQLRNSLYNTDSDSSILFHFQPKGDEMNLPKFMAEQKNLILLELC